MTNKMLQVLEAIDKMSDAEKVSTVEYLWGVLTAHYLAAFPEEAC